MRRGRDDRARDRAPARDRSRCCSRCRCSSTSPATSCPASPIRFLAHRPRLGGQHARAVRRARRARDRAAAAARRLARRRAARRPRRRPAGRRGRRSRSPTSLLVAARPPVDRPLAIGLMLAVTACTAVAVGTALGAARPPRAGRRAAAVHRRRPAVHRRPADAARPPAPVLVDARAGDLGDRRPAGRARSTAALAHAGVTVLACALIASLARKNSWLASTA